MALLEVQGVSKSFPGVQALSQIYFDVQPGEVHVLIGENGAGKSTLIKLLGGVYQPDAGIIRFDGKPVSFASPQDAKLAGIHTLYQEFNLLPEATVAENIFLGAEPRKRYLPLIDWQQMRSQTEDILQLLGLDIDPDVRVSDLNVAEQQMVELAKTLHVQPKLMLMDEPTATLSEREVRMLFRLIRLVQERGIGVIYISHRPAEILNIANRVTVLRDGKRVTTVDSAAVTTDQLINYVVGNSMTMPFVRPVNRRGNEVLRITGLTRRPTFEAISFELRAGEIVGLAGLVGSGRTALVRSIFDLDTPDSSTIYVNGEPVSIQSPRDAVALGIGLLPENRREQAMLLDMSARENITLTQLGTGGTPVGEAVYPEAAHQSTQPRSENTLPFGRHAAKNHPVWVAGGSPAHSITNLRAANLYKSAEIMRFILNLIVFWIRRYTTHNREASKSYLRSLVPQMRQLQAV